MIKHLLVLPQAEWILFFYYLVESCELLTFLRGPLIHLLVNLVRLFLEVVYREFSVFKCGLLLLELGELLALLLLNYWHLDVLSLDHPSSFTIA